MNEFSYSGNTLFHGECYLLQTDTEDYFWKSIQVVCQCRKYYRVWMRIMFQVQRWYSVEWDGYMAMNEKQIMISKKVIVTYLKVLSTHMHGENEENYESLNSEKPVRNRTRIFRIWSVDYYIYAHALTGKHRDLVTCQRFITEQFRHQQLKTMEENNKKLLCYVIWICHIFINIFSFCFQFRYKFIFAPIVQWEDRNFLFSNAGNSLFEISREVTKIYVHFYNQI
jgi:hypothetical protein